MSGISAFMDPLTSRYTWAEPARAVCSVCQRASGSNGLQSDRSAARRSPGESTGSVKLRGEGSRATFTVTEKLAQLSLPNDAVMRSTALTGEVRLDGRPSRVALDLMKLSSDQDRRDQFVRRLLFQQHPTAVLTDRKSTRLNSSH